ncbi:MAG: lysine--tRNA ligase [Candidatus Liptonbacteria bacterium]|nr:lysine--tRNA ligase [Candidatus Liptonbacteria bacterium]
MLDDLRNERLGKLKKISEAKIDPFPARVARSFSVGKALEKFAALSGSQKPVALAGRVMSIRDQGGVIFIDVKDESGQIQGVFKKENLKNFEFLRDVLDRGDFVSVSGPLFKTQKGQESVEVKEFHIAAKSIRPIPTEWYGVEETETRYRQRYLDLLANDEIKNLFRKKAIFWDAARAYLKKEGFLEIEAPVFETVPGGAEAEPFVTHYNALDSDFYLRISLELPLKKLLVGGFEKVFEIGRIFRNEGVSREHLQDYTQLEFYWAFHDYRDLMKLLEKMYKAVIKKVTGGLVTECGGTKIDWGAKWKKLEYVKAFRDANGLDPTKASRDELYEKARGLGLTPERNLGKGRLIDLIYRKNVRPNLIQPTFLVNPPVEIEPLAKRLPNDPTRVERVQIMACGTELGKGFSELNDPLDQRARFEEQMKLREAGDKEAQMLDEEYLAAMEYGMPPAAGFGASERFFAVLMDKPVRETTLFPLLRPK